MTGRHMEISRDHRLYQTEREKQAYYEERYGTKQVSGMAKRSEDDGHRQRHKPPLKKK